MTNITRRAALRGIASIPALAGATAAPAETQSPTPEISSAKVVRIAKELALALDDLNDEIMVRNHHDSGVVDVAVWIAEVWPASTKRSVCLTQIDLPIGRFVS